MRGQRSAGALRLAFVLFALTTGVSGTPSGAAEPAPDAGQGPTAAEIEDLSRRTFEHLYSKYVEVLTASGSEIQIRVGDIRVVMKEDFDRVHVQDVVTPAPPWRLRSDRSEVGVQGRRIGCTYRTTLEVTRPEEIQEGLLDWNPTLAQALRGEAESGEEQSRVDFAAIASASVHLVFDGGVLDYRSNLVWEAAGTGLPSKFRFNDMVAWGVMQAYVEQSPVMTQAELIRRETEAVDEERQKIEQHPPLAPPGSCVSETKDYTYPLANATDDVQHASGNHRNSSRFTFECNCDSACTSRASSSWETRTCYDAGQIYGLRYHQPITGEHREDDMIANALNQGARTKGTSACFIQSCPLIGGCSGGALTFSIGIAEITANFSGQQVWDGQLRFNGECGRCTELQPQRVPPGRQGRGPFHMDPDPTGGGGGGGSGYYASDCLFRCFPIFSDNPTVCGSNTPCWIETCEMVC